MRNNAPADADYWPEGRSYGLATATAHARRTGAYPRDEPAADYHPYDSTAGNSGWAPVPDERAWQDWQQWQNEVEPPDLHPDHPSAPVPMVQFPGWQETADDRYQAGQSGRFPGPGTVRFRSGRSRSTDSLWTEQVLTLADDHAARIGQDPRDHADAIRVAAERQAAALTDQAAGHATLIREDAEREATAIRRAAEHEAAAIREAAEREAAELKAALDTMRGELGRAAAYFSDNLGSPATLSIAPPASPDTYPALPRATPAQPTVRPAPPTSRPARPGTGPDIAPARPGSVRPAAPARAPHKVPAKKPGKPGRQSHAMRVAAGATAALFLVAVGTGVTELATRGFPFFVFRPGGTGETAGSETDQQFLANEAAAAHHIPPVHHALTPKGRHHKKQALAVHHS